MSKAAENWKELCRRFDSVYLRARDPFRTWELNTRPESRVASELGDAVTLLCGDGEPDLAKKLLRQCISVYDRAESEGKWLSERCKDAFPGNRGAALRAKVYAQGLLLDQPLDQEALANASSDLETISRDDDSDEVVQDQYLSAVRLALLAGNADRARALLKRRRNFKLQAVELAFIKAVLDKTVSVVDAHFDRIRDPQHMPRYHVSACAHPVEIGALRDMYFVSPDKTVGMGRVIQAMCAP